MKPRRSRAPWTLRRRLVVSVVVLFSLLSVVVGGVSLLVLYRNLSDPISDQLLHSASYAEQRASRGFAPSFNGGGGPGVSGLQPGSITAYSAGDTIVGTLSPRLGGSSRTLTQTELTPLAAMTRSHIPTDTDVAGLGDFRIIRTDLLFYEDPATGVVTKYYGYTAYPLAQTQATLAQFGLALGGISLGGILLVAFATWFIVAYALRPLRRVAATATEVASMPLDRGEVDLAVRVPEADTDKRTEVGQVGAALNTMLGHVDDALKARQASESRVRKFVADASHELRTPLASIRGYAELTRRGDYDLPKDVTHSLGRVESEAVRMTSLVEDLLLLARLDAGREIETAPVDLSRLLVDCVSDAHVAGPDHEFELDLPEDPVIIEGDAQRTHQVFANLLANARVHTPAGTHVAVALTRVAPGGAVVTVSDDGPGIPGEVHDDLFERFARGDASRTRATGSTGLGLAIVRAVVDAHGGAVTVATSSAGTTFKVDLPGAGAHPSLAD